MADRHISERIDLSRRNLLKLAVSGLVAGTAGPALLGLSPARAAGPALAGRRVLTVCFSRTGNTRTMAGYIHEAVGGDLVRIETVDPYPSEYRATARQARRELDSGYRPPLATRVEGMASYGVVFVGSPCWWGTISTPVISFLSGYDFSGKTLVPFMTHMGSGLGRAMAHVGRLCPGATVLRGKAIRGDEVGSARGEVEAWLRGMDMA